MNETVEKRHRRCGLSHRARFAARVHDRGLPSALLAAAVMVIGGLASPCFAERLAVTSPVANIRSGPGTNYDVLWQIEQYHPIEIIEKKGNWYRFQDYQGDTGYIHKSLLGKMTTVISARSKCNVRSGPGTRYPVVFTVGDGVPFKVIEKKHNWLHIEHGDGDRGWIYRSLVW